VDIETRATWAADSMLVFTRLVGDAIHGQCRKFGRLLMNARVAFQGNGGFSTLSFESLDQAHHDRDHDGHDGDRRVTTGMMHVPDTHGFSKTTVTVTSHARSSEAENTR